MKVCTIKDFNQQFPDEDACLEWLKNHLYPDGIKCPKCKKITKHHRIKGRTAYSCDICGSHTFPMAKTILRKSTTPLRSWMYAIYLIASTRCGISAKQLQRELGVTYKTAWRMFTQIRDLLNETKQPLNGQVEVDETYIGGKKQGKRGRGAEGKSKVIGAAQRKGKVVAQVVDDVRMHTIIPFTVRNVDRNAVLFTDEFPSYDHMARYGFNHLKIRHHDKEYVRGKVHTNNIEGFWSLVKRGISGVYHSVSPKYLQSYLNEYAFRYNHRKDETPMFETILARLGVPE